MVSVGAKLHSSALVCLSLTCLWKRKKLELLTGTCRLFRRALAIPARSTQRGGASACSYKLRRLDTGDGSESGARADQHPHTLILFGECFKPILVNLTCVFAT
ncbi:jg23005 [Pararge aegeria aegeria]|uniref:Jg23005 protein n=1 Tax=Pararge aegeria aegeria TaxID=348720 RepID=A0A8S4QV77_9NEOP|nr:jg23005 [Pararge aegeria aegeria]